MKNIIGRATCFLGGKYLWDVRILSCNSDVIKGFLSARDLLPLRLQCPSSPAKGHGLGVIMNHGWLAKVSDMDQQWPSSPMANELIKPLPLGRALCLWLRSRAGSAQQGRDVHSQVLRSSGHRGGTAHSSNHGYMPVTSMVMFTSKYRTYPARGTWTYPNKANSRIKLECSRRAQGLTQAGSLARLLIIEPLVMSVLHIHHWLLVFPTSKQHPTKSLNPPGS